MLMRVVFLWLCLVGLPVTSNAAGIYESTEIDKLLPDSQKNNTSNATPNNENIPTYKSELSSILQKHGLLKKIEGQKSSSENNLVTEEKSSFIQELANEDIDAQILMETDATWKEIKDKLDYLNILFNKIDMWAEDHLVTDGEIPLISSIERIEKSHYVKFRRNQFQYQNHYFFEQKTKNNKRERGSPNYNDNYDDYSNTSPNSRQKNPYEKNVFSLLYLWEKYSGYIIGLGVIFVFWTVAQSLIHLMNRPGR
jgi:hypothetical protein